jgi:hypothetical protein
LGAILLTTTLYGLMSDHAYRLDRKLELESIAQDVLTLAIVPLLIWAGHRSRTGSPRTHLLWLGLLAYVGYTYFIYAIGIPQNRVSLFYLAALTLSVTALIDGLGRIDVKALAPAFGRSSTAASGGS